MLLLVRAADCSLRSLCSYSGESLWGVELWSCEVHGNFARASNIRFV